MPLQMDDFIAYACQFRPEFACAIQGAKPEEISRLAWLAQVSPTSEYIAFMSKMGRCDGGLDLAVDGSADIRLIIEYYRQCQATGGRFPPRCVLLVSGYLGEMFVEFRSEGELRVVEAEGEAITGVYADSLEKLLYRSAFAEFAMRKRPHSALLTGSYADLGYRSVLGEAEALAGSLGFSREWFSDSQVLCCRSGSALMTLTQYEGQGIGVILATDTRREILRIWATYKRAFGLELGEWG